MNALGVFVTFNYVALGWLFFTLSTPAIAWQAMLEIVWFVLIYTIRPFRLLMKALIVFAILNVAFAVFNPPVGELSVYGWPVPGD